MLTRPAAMNNINGHNGQEYLFSANELKAKGNEFFKTGHYIQALEKYQHALGAMSHILPFGDYSKEVAILWNNRANALFKLGKWEDAYLSATQSFTFIPHFAKAYFRAGHCLLMLGNTHVALVMFMNGLMNLQGSDESRDVAEFLHGIFKTFEDGGDHVGFRDAYNAILREGFGRDVWKMLIAKLVKENMYKSCFLLMTTQVRLPNDIKDLNKISLAGIFKDSTDEQLETSNLAGGGLDLCPVLAVTLICQTNAELSKPFNPFPTTNNFVNSSSFGNMSRITDLVTWFINMGADVDTIGEHPLHSIIKLCIKSGDSSLFKLVINNTPAKKKCINEKDTDGNTLLHLVASFPTNSNDFTPKRQTQCVKMLLSYGADPCLVNKHKKDVATILKQNKNFSAEDAVKKHVASQSPPVVQPAGLAETSIIPDEGSSFALAVERFVKFCKQASPLNTVLEHQSVRRFLNALSSAKDIASDITCDIPDSITESLITQLIQQKRWQEVLLLLTRDASGESIQEGLIKSCHLPKVDIHHVISNLDPTVKYRLRLVKLLLKRGVSPNGIGAMHEHPICTCLKRSDFAMAYLLLCNGGDPESVCIAKEDNPLHTAVSIALNNKDDDGILMVKYLLDLYSSDPAKYQYLDPNIQDKDGNTVMHKVFQNNNPKQYRKIMELLAKFDIKLTVNNRLGRDAKYKIKNIDQRFVVWNEVRKKSKQPNAVPKSGKANGNNTQAKMQAKPSSFTSLPRESASDESVMKNQCASSEHIELPAEFIENTKNPMTPKEQLVQTIRKLIICLDLSKAQSLFDTLKRCAAEHAPEIKNTELTVAVVGSCREAELLDDGASREMSEDTENKITKLDNNGEEWNGEQLQDNIDLSNVDFSTMTWEIECSPEALKKLGSKAVPLYMKNKIIISIQKLGNGEWTRGLNKQLKLNNNIKLFEVKLDKGGRMLWELAVDFSPRCSEDPEKIMATELVPQKSGRVYTEIIRIWDIVLDHCKLNHAIENICGAYNRGMSCILRKKLKGITKDQIFPNTKKRIPKYFVEDTEVESNIEHIPDYFPPAGAMETEYNIMKFHSFSTDMALNILSNMNSRVEYPFRVGELEYAVIDLNPKPMEAIILIGRSGTGKTTCCLYRLWKKFHSYWERAESVGGPWLAKQTWQRRKYNENTEDDILEDEDTEQELSDSTDEEQASEELENLESEVTSSDNEEDTKLEHYHPIFVTKNHVLCQEVQRNFLELSKSAKATSNFKPIEPNVYKLQDIKDENFPLFITSQQLLLLLDASMPDPLFPRNEDGSLKKSIVGWSAMNDTDILDLLRDDDESEPDPEDAEEEKECEPKENDPRIFVTFELFAKKLWPNMIKGKSSYNAALVWKEIKSFLKGSFEALSCLQGRLSEEEYIKLGKKRAPNFQGDRREIYRLFCLYEQTKNSQGYFDEEDVLYNLSCRLSKLEELPWSIHELYGDEIQDFTQAELFLLMRCINDPNYMFLTGDTAQSIMKGVSFRFSDLRSLFYYANKKCSDDKKKCIVRRPKQLYHLYQNYRSHSGILSLASGVVDLLQHFFPESFDRLPRDCGLFDGPKPTVLESCSVSDLAILLRGNKRKTQPIEFGAHQVILVTNEISKENIPEELSLALVLTIYEAKGLEFDDVLLYNFFTDSEASKEWRIISSFNPVISTNQKSQPLIEVPLEDACSHSSRPFIMDPEMHKILNGELKQLYTAITRARVNLWIFDENLEKRAPAFDYFLKSNLVSVVRTDKNKDLDDNMFVKTSTNNEWISRGDYYANHQCWKVAAKCYQKGGAVEKEKLAFAHDDVLSLQAKTASVKEKQLGYLRLAKTYLECREPKLAMKCLNKSKEFSLCAELCKKMEKIKDAAFFYKKAQDHKLAAQLYEQAGEYNTALNLYYREKMYEEAVHAIERYRKMYPTAPLQITEKKLCLEAAANFFRNNNLSRMTEMLSKLDTEDQLIFLKNRKCWTEAAELLKSNDRCEEAASLMREHGMLLEAANLTRRREFRASCLLAAARHCLANNQDPDSTLSESLHIFYDTNNKVQAAEAILLQGILENSFTTIIDSFYHFLHASHHAGVVESLFHALTCEDPNPKLLFLASFGLELLLQLVKSLKETRTNADREMVKSCLEFYGVVQLEEQQCSILVHEGARFSQIESEEHSEPWDLKDVKLLLIKHLLKRLHEISVKILEKGCTGICSNFIVGRECHDENCPNIHQTLSHFELKTILRSKINLITICGLLFEAQKLNEDFSIDFKTTGMTAGFKYCNSLLNLVFAKHFHMRILSENPKMCQQVLLKISVPAKTMLTEFLASLLRESKRDRRESTDLWLQIMQICSLLSQYPDALQRYLNEEEMQYKSELEKQNKMNDSQEDGNRNKYLEGRQGMLKPDTSGGWSHVHFFRLLQGSVDELFINKNPDGCKRYFYRFMNFVVKKCIEPLIPNIGNTMMLLEFQFILCCAVLMRFSKCTVLLPKSYISILHFWETMFRKKNSLKDTYSILWEYRPRDVGRLTAHFQYHITYLASVLCGHEHAEFNVLLDAFKCVDFISSGEAERSLVFYLVMMVNLDSVVSEKARPILRKDIPQLQRNIKDLQKEFPLEIPQRLVSAVDKVTSTDKDEELINLLQDLLAQRDNERLVECSWRWDTNYGKGSVRGIFFDDRFKFRKHGNFQQKVQDYKPTYLDHEQDYEEEKADLLATVAVQAQKQKARQKISMLFLFACIWTKWKRACTNMWKRQMEESVPDNFKRANVDRTQCDLCGVRFSQAMGVSDLSEIEDDIEEIPTPTMQHIEELDTPRIQDLNESYEDHIKHEKHRQQCKAYGEYLDFFKHEVDVVISEGRFLVQTIDAKTKLTSHEEFHLVQPKIESKIKIVSDLMEDIYEHKTWSQAEECLWSPVNDLRTSISEGLELLKKPEQQATKTTGGLLVRLIVRDGFDLSKYTQLWYRDPLLSSLRFPNLPLPRLEFTSLYLSHYVLAVSMACCYDQEAWLCSCLYIILSGVVARLFDVSEQEVFSASPLEDVMVVASLSS
ncbi:PREDICTED: TPR and ankyrin repeat-containing protein 1 [Nanorana parkeri]|uniref:TPR and ankyrin repeat-containing protein 1 n=1 Tax=Nanorana parkeri TaxID=125878 RepID=UPI00085477B4|nr:PREDICTED: TPR and ankyrin repeat-containing protein 1 [Nanorana parkeri]